MDIKNIKKGKNPRGMGYLKQRPEELKERWNEMQKIEQEKRLRTEKKYPNYTPRAWQKSKEEAENIAKRDNVKEYFIKKEMDLDTGETFYVLYVNP